MTDEIGIPLYTLFQAVGLVMSIGILFFSLRGLASLSSPEVIYQYLVARTSEVFASALTGILNLV